MTHEEAAAEAQRRWGSDGVARQRPGAPPKMQHMVGVLFDRSKNWITVKGEGATWELAFEAAGR